MMAQPLEDAYNGAKGPGLPWVTLRLGLLAYLGALGLLSPTIILGLEEGHCSSARRWSAS